MSEMAKMNSQKNVVSGEFRKNWIIRMLGRLKAWHLHRKTIRELNAMSDMLLRDIGIDRYEIPDVVYQRGAFANLPTSLPKTAAVAPLNKAAA